MKFVDAERSPEAPMEAKKRLPVKGVPAAALCGLTFVFLGLFSLTGLFADRIEATFPEVETIPVEEIHAGMRG